MAQMKENYSPTVLKLSRSSGRVSTGSSSHSLKESHSTSSVPPRYTSSMPNLHVTDSIGKLMIKAEGTFLDTKKFGKVQSGLELIINHERVFSSLATGPNPNWREKMLIDVADYTFSLRAILFKAKPEKEKRSKIADTEFSLDVRIISDGQLLAASFHRKKKLVANIKLFIQFMPQNYEYEKLEKLILTDPNILAVLFDTHTQFRDTEVEKMTTGIFSLFEYNDRLLDLMKHIITYEVEKVDDVALMLRDQTPTVQLLSSYIKSFGNLFLRKIEKNILPQLIADRWQKVELDTCKLGPKDDLQQNIIHLEQKADMVISTIFSLHAYIHPWIRELCKYLIRTVEKRFPERANIGLGAVLFLRYICPSLVSPPPTTLIGKTFASDPDLRRTLILITKLMQALSNNVMFGEKEPYMVCMNDFLLMHQPKLLEFYDHILNGQSETDVEEELEKYQRKKVPGEVYRHLHRYLHFNKQLLISRLEKYPNKDDQKERTEVVLASILSELEVTCASSLEDNFLLDDLPPISVSASPSI